MYSLVRRYLKTAVAFLLVGLATGVWLLVRRELLGLYPTPHLTSAHTHALLVGFVMQLILGVALWLFPRPERGDARYDPRLAEAAYWLVSGGTAVRVAGELARGVAWSGAGAAWLRWAIVAGGVAQAVGLAVYFHTMWSRIRPVGSALREARGERF